MNVKGEVSSRFVFFLFLLSSLIFEAFLLLSLREIKDLF